MGKSFYFFIGFMAMLFGFAFYVLFQLDNKNDELIDQIKLIEEQSEKRWEEDKGKIIGWVQEFTDDEAEYLYQEKDSLLHVVKAGKELYKVKYVTKENKVIYVLNNDEVVFE